MEPGKHGDVRADSQKRKIVFKEICFQTGKAVPSECDDTALFLVFYIIGKQAVPRSLFRHILRDTVRKCKPDQR